MRTTKGKLVIISAPSGAGKSTIVKHLLEKGLSLMFSVSATTRMPRGCEKNGVDYYFLSTEEFRRKVAAGDFVEWEEVYQGQLYGSLKSELEKIWEKGSHVLFDVDVQGGIRLKKIFGAAAISIFIMPPSVGELAERLRKRGTDSPEKIALRLAKAEEEIKLASGFDKIVVNDELKKAENEVYNIVTDFLSI
jgi:guanylate kinase